MRECQLEDISTIALITDTWIGFKLQIVTLVLRIWYAIEQPEMLVVAKKNGSYHHNKLSPSVAYRAFAVHPAKGMLYYDLKPWPSLRGEPIRSVPSDEIEAINFSQIPLLQPFKPSP